MLSSQGFRGYQIAAYGIGEHPQLLLVVNTLSLEFYDD